MPAAVATPVIVGRFGSAAAAVALLLVPLLAFALLPGCADAHDSYGVCELHQCRCDNASLSLECQDGHDLTVHSLLRLPSSYRRIVIDGFLVAEVLDGGELAAFADLSELRLTHCRIERVGSSALAGLSRLRKLSLAGNHVRLLTAATLKGVGGLVELDLSDNLLQELDPGLFDGFAQLRSLDLSGNKIRRLPAASVFDALRSLRRLDLSGNELAYVFPRTFVAMVELEMINLQRNLLVTVQEGVLAGKPSLRSALFGGNPLECNCGVQWLRDRLRLGGSDGVGGNGSLPTLCMSDGAPLASKTDDELRCTPPIIESVSVPLQTYQRNPFRLFCNASGRPRPAVVWRLPCGDYLADPSHGEWLHDAIHTFYGSRTYYITATADELTFSVSPSADSSGGHELLVSSLRRFSEGTYACIAMSPAGNASVDVEVVMVAPIGDIYVPSLVFGAGATSGGTLLVGALGCVIQRACRNRRKRKCRKRAAARAAGSQRTSLLGSASGLSANNVATAVSYGCSATDAATATTAGNASGRRDSDDANAVVAVALTESHPEPGPSDSLLRANDGAAGYYSNDQVGESGDSDYDDSDDDDEEEEEDDGDVYGSEYESDGGEAAADENYDAFAVGVTREDSLRQGCESSADGTAAAAAASGGQLPLDCRSPGRSSGSRMRDPFGGMKLKLRSPSRGERLDTMERLRLNMEKKAERVKVKMEKRAERMRTNMERHRERMRDTLLNIRESTSHSLQSIRDTSSSYAHKLHAGVRNAMENVGYTVQSLKELCGAGDLGLTMSVATIATNVDTDEQVQVVRNVTRV